ncbi:MAG: DUF1810 domain-containing protein [Planctomycetota bacterium]|jgi:uncharacterized protein (DUF1810 family)|nr:DUF1810 domain-containing protein [Planctomycetota bacterium]MDP6761470.1 DUF1810 domain-containing protein [Planctomycetota bacterium]MDP6989432.1 DUF1810 domain-containing protein [Planctomycetota bacterium]
MTLCRPREDPFDLDRFTVAQEGVFERALNELRAGEKRTHWMWFVFPQLRGLGRSPTAEQYGISGAAEARAFLAHELLGPRLAQACETLLAVPDRSAHDILGSPDDTKLRSCATLFARVSPEANSVFRRILERFCDGNEDQRTVGLLEEDG